MKIFKKPEFKKWLKEPKNRTLVIALISMLLLILFVELKPTGNSSDSAPPETADTYIPAGFVLVPIELQNSDSLSSLVGNYAIVDLFTGSPGIKHQRVGQRLKLLRAPLNPQQFAVLVPEEFVSTLLGVSGPYWAAIQNPTDKKSGALSKKVKSKIDYFQGGH